MLGYVYGQTTSRLLSSEMLPIDRGLPHRQTTSRELRLGSPALQNAEFRNQSGGAHWEPLRATILWVAGRHHWTQANV
jgi:hypothetical protein